MQLIDRFSRALGVLVLGITACGDDGAASDTDHSSSSSSGAPDPDSSTAPPDTTEDSDASVTADTSSSGMPADTSSSGVADSSSSSTGTPNEPPIAVDDSYLVMMDARPLSVDATLGVLANDVDPEGGPLVVDTSDALSIRGSTVAVEMDGAFVFTPPADLWGADAFGYTAADEDGATDDALARVMVAPTTVSVGDLLGDPVGFAIHGVTDLDETGYAVAGAGDVNGDGFADIVVGARSTDVVADTEGRAWVAFGKPDGDALALADAATDGTGFAIDGVGSFDQAGHSVAIAGDVNGDGLADVVIGAPFADPLGNDEGMAWVVFGKTDTDTVTLASLAADGAGFAIAGLVGDDNLGFAVAGGGDVDGDGLDDVLVGAPQSDVGALVNAGRAWVVHGKADTAPVDLAQVGTGVGGFVIRGFDGEARAGDAVAVIGDANGDGLADVAVGAPLGDASGGNSGQIYVVWGKSDGTAVDLDDVVAGFGGFTIDGEEATDQAGDAIAPAGDVDGDGLADLVIGAAGAEADPDVADVTGRSYVVFGKDDNFTVDLVDVVSGVGGFAMDGEVQFDLSGFAVGGGGDIDGDGLADVVIGAHGQDANGFSAGRSYVVYGRTETSAIALVDIADGIGGFAIDGESVNDLLGWSCAGAGDVSGDGFADVVAGAPGAVGANGPGAAYAVFGGNFRGLVTIVGTDADDTLEGTAADESMAGGLGADLLRSGGGFDVIHAGPGDDTIELSSTELFRIDGGSGFDTLALAGSGVQLELDAFFDVALVGIERIDLTGLGDNAVFLAARDLRALSDTSNELVVIGDDGDQVVADFTGAGFVDAGVIDGFQVWSTGILTLLVDADVQAFVTL